MHSRVKGIEEIPWLLDLIERSKRRKLRKLNYFRTYFKQILNKYNDMFLPKLIKIITPT